MNTSDLILYLVDKYISEKEKNFLLQYQLDKQSNKIQDDGKIKTN